MKQNSFAAVLALTASVLKEMNITLQCVTCPLNCASNAVHDTQSDLQDVDPSVTERLRILWPLMLNTDAAFAD